MRIKQTLIIATIAALTSTAAADVALPSTLTIDGDRFDGVTYRGHTKSHVRIFHESGAEVPGKPRLRFPWIGIWEHEAGGDGLIVLPPEDVRYLQEDFLPLGRTDFLGASVGIPNKPTNILNTYFESKDWMEFCVLPYRDHRNGGELTGFSKDKFKLKGVLNYLASERLPAQ